jgi:hypothetical protein
MEKYSCILAIQVTGSKDPQPAHSGPHAEPGVKAITGLKTRCYNHPPMPLLRHTCLGWYCNPPPMTPCIRTYEYKILGFQSHQAEVKEPQEVEGFCVLLSRIIY